MQLFQLLKLLLNKMMKIKIIAQYNFNNDFNKLKCWNKNNNNFNVPIIKIKEKKNNIIIS